MSVGTPPQPGFHAMTAFRRFSVAEYHRLIETGVLTEEDKVELLNGYVVLKMPRNPPHDVSIPLTQEALRILLPSGWCIRSQGAITLATSEPEPDVVVARGSWRDYQAHHPGPSEIGLVVEVAESSLTRDRDDKGPIYADAGLPVYWIVNLVDRQLEVYTQPSGTVAAARYAQRQDFRPGDSVHLLLDGAVVGQVAVRDVLP